jgi:TonB-dependent SusC/RagA subfamily outer membrane receptor
MKKLLVIFSLFLSVSAFAQKADSAKKELKITPSSTYGSASPLVMVDGVKYKGNVNSIPPNDIESIEVLKDASAKTLYGEEAKNGVILITTKKAKAAGIKLDKTITTVEHQRRYILLIYTLLSPSDDNTVLQTYGGVVRSYQGLCAEKQGKRD